MKILMVCLGNICRSPLAEGIARDLVEKEGLDWYIDSAGTSGWHDGDPPDHRSIAVARSNGIDITRQQSRELAHQDLEEFDVIVAMDAQNFQDIQRKTSEDQRDKVYMMMNFAYPNQNRAVPDPYYGGINDFEKVYDQLVKACQAMIQYFR